MKKTVLGVQKVDYISKKTGEPVKGITLHCSCKDADVIGEAVETLFISDRLELSADVYAVQPGQIVDVEYNRRGYVADVAVCD